MFGRQQKLEAGFTDMKYETRSTKHLISELVSFDLGMASLVCGLHQCFAWPQILIFRLQPSPELRL